MTIILSAFNGLLRSKPFHVSLEYGRYHKVMALPSEMPWALGKTVCAKELTFVDRGKREYSPTHPWTHDGEIRIYELEVPS